MTREEAIKILKELPNSILGVVLPFDIDFDYTQALDMAIKALERDTPMKVNVEQWIYTNCPSGCGYELSTHHGDGYYSIDKNLRFVLSADRG